MTKKVRSMKGETVDFDLFRIKEQISKSNKSEEAVAREQFVYSKRRRGSKRTVDNMRRDQEASTAKVKESLAAQKEKVAPKVDTKAEKAKEAAPVPESKPTRRIIKKNKA